MQVVEQLARLADERPIAPPTSSIAVLDVSEIEYEIGIRESDVDNRRHAKQSAAPHVGLAFVVVRSWRRLDLSDAVWREDDAVVACIRDGVDRNAAQSTNSGLLFGWPAGVHPHQLFHGVRARRTVRIQYPYPVVSVVDCVPETRYDAAVGSQILGVSNHGHTLREAPVQSAVRRTVVYKDHPVERICLLQQGGECSVNHLLIVE